MKELLKSKTMILFAVLVLGITYISSVMEVERQKDDLRTTPGAQAVIQNYE